MVNARRGGRRQGRRAAGHIPDLPWRLLRDPPLSPTPAAGLRDRSGRGVRPRPGGRCPSTPTTRRIDIGQRHPVRPGRVGLDHRRCARAPRPVGEIKAGCVWINDHIPIVSEMPHGGFKQSGIRQGHEHVRASRSTPRSNTSRSTSPVKPTSRGTGRSSPGKASKWSRRIRGRSSSKRQCRAAASSVRWERPARQLSSLPAAPAEVPLANLQPQSGGGDSKTIVWANWTLYLDFDRRTRSYPTLEAVPAQDRPHRDVPRGH